MFYNIFMKGQAVKCAVIRALQWRYTGKQNGTLTADGVSRCATLLRVSAGMNGGSVRAGKALREMPASVRATLSDTGCHGT